jgi:hypothetical protein
VRVTFNVEEGTWMVVIVERRLIFALLAAALVVDCVMSVVGSAHAANSYSIELEEFRWTKFPLRVLVDMNQWSMQGYAVDVREALDDWMKSIWNYTQTFNDTSLPTMSYVLYLSSTNATQDYDVLVTFTPDRIPPGSSVVGLTTYDWNPSTNEPIRPITINLTTSFGTAGDLFVKDVVMHEFGHALGLGHASSSSTLNGPELMYYTSSRNEVVYPSTLDVYGLTQLYRGVFSQSVQLPVGVAYVMLAEGAVPSPVVTPSVTDLWDEYKKYLPVAVALLLLIVAAVVLGHIGKGEKPEEPTQPLPPPPPLFK